MSKSLKIMKDAFIYYLQELQKIRNEGYDDNTAEDVENCYVVQGLINEYEEYGIIKFGDEFQSIEEELIEYFGDEERVELVLSFFRIAKDLIDRGVALSI